MPIFSAGLGNDSLWGVWSLRAGSGEITRTLSIALQLWPPTEAWAQPGPKGAASERHLKTWGWSASLVTPGWSAICKCSWIMLIMKCALKTSFSKKKISWGPEGKGTQCAAFFCLFPSLFLTFGEFLFTLQNFLGTEKRASWKQNQVINFPLQT